MSKTKTPVPAFDPLVGDLPEAVDVTEDLVAVRAPETMPEQQAVKLAAKAPGSISYIELGEQYTPTHARTLARAIARVRLPKFGVTDRHLQVDAGLWQRKGEPIPKTQRLRVKVIEGKRPTHSTKPATPEPQPDDVGEPGPMF